MQQLIFSFMDSFYLNNRFFLGLTFCDFGPLGIVPLGGARGQNLGHLKKSFFFFFAFIFLLCNQSYLRIGTIQG